MCLGSRLHDPGTRPADLQAISPEANSDLERRRFGYAPESVALHLTRFAKHVCREISLHAALSDALKDPAATLADDAQMECSLTVACKT